MSELSLLNVGTGDTKISFAEDASEEEIMRASVLVRDMIRKGYAILVEVGRDDKGSLYRRAHDFDESTHEYIVAGLPPEDSREQENKEEEVAPEKPTKRSYKTRAKGGKPRTERISARKAKAVAVPRTAGG